MQCPHNASGYFTIYGEDSNYQDHFNVRDFSLRLKTLDIVERSSPRYECSAGASDTVEGCFHRHVLARLGCRLPWRTQDLLEGPVCGNESEALGEIHMEEEHIKAAPLVSLLNCRLPCQRYSYIFRA